MNSPDPRDEAFLQYWNTQVIDPTDPAAPQWIEHCSNRIVQCREIVKHVSRHDRLDGRSVLDIGCQTGALGIAMAEAGARVTGIDVTSWLVQAGRMRSQGWGIPQSWVTAQSEALPFRDASFDVVMFIDVIEHVQDAGKCLDEIVRVLRPGGVVYLQGPNRFSPQWFIADPHYGLLGASVLPPSLGRRYVEWRRGRKGYDVGVFPVGHRVVHTLKRLGCSILEPPALPSDSATDTPLNRGRRWAWSHLRLAIGAMFTVVARRDAPI